MKTTSSQDSLAGKYIKHIFKNVCGEHSAVYFTSLCDPNGFLGFCNNSWWFLRNDTARETSELLYQKQFTAFARKSQFIFTNNTSVTFMKWKSILYSTHRILRSHSYTRTHSLGVCKMAGYLQFMNCVTSGLCRLLKPASIAVVN